MSPFSDNEIDYYRQQQTDSLNLFDEFADRKQDFEVNAGSIPVPRIEEIRSMDDVQAVLGLLKTLVDDRQVRSSFFQKAREAVMKMASQNAAMAGAIIRIHEQLREMDDDGPEFDLGDAEPG